MDGLDYQGETLSEGFKLFMVCLGKLYERAYRANILHIPTMEMRKVLSDSVGL